SPQSSLEDLTVHASEPSVPNSENSLTAANSIQTLAIITAQEASARINIRTLPSVDSEPVGYALVGDEFVLEQSATDTSDNVWHHVTSLDSELSGWVHGDFLKVQPSTSIAETGASSSIEEDIHEEDILKDALAKNCRVPLKVHAYFLTQNHIIYLCYQRDDLVYVSQEKGTEHVISVNDVKVLQDSYVITNETYEYHLDANTFRVVHLDDAGKETAILSDPIIHSEQY
ncbi:MAG: SH3 domain-containing protein, partial [Cyanobacteria bacterium P01_H01_bin.58]